MTKKMVGNDLPERTVAYWRATGEILPEVQFLREDIIEELIDSIHIREKDLLNALGRFLESCM